MIPWEPTLLRTRDGDEQQAELGSIEVPENRNSDNSRLISLKFARLGNRSKNPPIIFLSGGPGDSGIQWASHGPFLEVFRRVIETHDLILLDQRGCGQSQAKLSVPFPKFVPQNALASEQDYLSFLTDHLVSTADVHRSLGADLNGYTVVQSALDIEDLRIALGVEKVILWGYSYGTHLTQMAVKLLGDHIDRVILCGFEGPNQTFKFPSQIEAQVVRLSERFRNDGYDFINDMDAAHEWLETPVETEIALDKANPSQALSVGKFAIQQLAASWIGISNRFYNLPKLYQSLAKHETTELVKQLPVYAKNWCKPLTFYLKDSASGATKDRWNAISKTGDYRLGNAANFPFPSIGTALQTLDMGDELRAPLTSNLPFFIVTGSLDGFTPTSNALESISLLPNAIHTEIAGAAHNDLISDKQVITRMVEFMNGL